MQRQLKQLSNNKLLPTSWNDNLELFYEVGEYDVQIRTAPLAIAKLK
jgi:hypothetical protein